MKRNGRIRREDEEIAEYLGKDKERRGEGGEVNIKRRGGEQEKDMTGGRKKERQMMEHRVEREREQRG